MQHPGGERRRCGLELEPSFSDFQLQTSGSKPRELFYHSFGLLGMARAPAQHTTDNPF